MRQFDSVLDPMNQTLLNVTLLVREYDEAIDFFVKKLNFRLLENLHVPAEDKRWVVVAPRGNPGSSLLLARASTDEQRKHIGNQTAGRVAFFLGTDDFWRDYKAMVSAGVNFVREPKVEPYGTVAVFEDLYGNLWDLLQRSVAS